MIVLFFHHGFNSTTWYVILIMDKGEMPSSNFSIRIGMTLPYFTLIVEES